MGQGLDTSTNVTYATVVSVVALGIVIGSFLLGLCYVVGRVVAAILGS